MGRNLWLRRFPLVLCGVLLLGSCGGGEMSLTEYVERVDAIFNRGIERYEALISSPQGAVLAAEREQLANYTPQDLHVALEGLAEIQVEALASAAEIEPPQGIAEIHTLFFRRLPIDELAARAGTASDWEELSDSQEMSAYRAALVDDERVCNEFQATLDATVDRGVFADNPWVPDEMTEIVEYALGCGAFVESPEDIYRPVPG